MEQNKFQWCLFNQDRSQQWVVRCDDFDEFVVAIQQVLSIMHGVETVLTSEEPAVNGARNGKEERAPVKSGSPTSSDLAPAAPPPAEEGSNHFCPIHKDKQMKLRSGKNGQSWYDHRWKEGNVWFQCNGERVREG